MVLARRREKTMEQLCEEFEISRPTGYEWLRRYEKGGIAGVVEKSRRPEHSPQRTAAGIEQRVVELRQQRPDWGARKLRVLLQREGVELPADHDSPDFVAARVWCGGRIGIARPCNDFERGAPNQLWQMDFKGSGGMERADRATVGAGRSQPVCDRAGGNGIDASRAGASSGWQRRLSAAGCRKRC